MDTVVGFTGKDYTIIMADAGIARSIVRMKEDEDKIMSLDQSKMMGTSGPVGDRVQFGEYIQKNIALYAIRNNYPLTTHGAAHFVRNELATALREGPYQVNLLIGGVDQSSPSLYYIDYLGSMHKMNYAVHGYAAYFLLSVLDRLYTKDMTLEQGLALAKKCQAQIQQRFMPQNPCWTIKVVDSKGIRVLEKPPTILGSN